MQQLTCSTRDAFKEINNKTDKLSKNIDDITLKMETIW